MANTVLKVKRTSTAGRMPNTTNSGNTQYIPAGGLALNMTDMIMFSSDGTNVIPIGANNVNLRASNSFYIGNSTVNVSSNSTTLMVGNSTVNCTVNSTVIYTEVGMMNDQLLTFDYTIPGTRNCVVAGPYTVNTNVTLTVANGGRFVVV